MKRINKISIIALFAVMFMSVVDAWGLGINKYVPLNLQAESNQGTWDANSKKLGWKQSYSNLYFLTALSNKNFTGYDKITVNVSNANNQNYRLLITAGGKDYTAAMSGNGEKVLNLKNSFKQGTNGNGTTVDLTNKLSNVTSVRIGGNSNNGSITLNSITLHKTIDWNSNNQMTFTAFDFNCGDNVTATNNNTFSFTGQYQSITLNFDSDFDLSQVISENQNFSASGTSTYTCYENGNNVQYGFNAAQNAKMKINLYRICVNGKGTVTVNSVVFTKKVFTAPVESTPTTSFDVTSGRIFFEDFENLDNNSARNGNKGIEALTDANLMKQYENRPENDSEDGKDHRSWQGKYLNYGGRGKIMNDPAFGKYYQNLADADVYTKSIAENYLRMIFTDAQKSYMRDEINKAGTGNRAATIGFWVNGKIAVENELPLERGSMFSIFSNYRFRKADNYDEKPRFMFDLACNGWTYSYMPNNDGTQRDNYFFYGEKNTTNSSSNPLKSLFDEENYRNPLDQSQHKFYDDEKWHYVSYVMDKDFTRVIIYLDGKETGRINDVRALDKNKFEVKFEQGGDYVGRFYYLRNLVLGGFTPHGLFYDKQYYSDAALAYDDIAIYSKALTPEQIKAIIEKKGYTPKEWQFGNDNKSAHGASFNDDDKTVGLGLTNPSEDEDGYIVMGKNTELTIPNVPAGHYVRVEYKYVDDNDQKMPTSTDNNLFNYVGLRDSENDANFQTITFHANATKAYHYFLTINSPIAIRSIIITPYQYADLKWAAEKVEFSVVGTTYKQGNTTVTPSQKYPALLLNIDGKRNANGTMFYENVATGYKQGKNNPYIKYSSSAPHVATVNTQGTISPNAIAGNTNITAEVISDNLFEGSNTAASFEIVIKKEENTLRLVADKHDINVNDKYPEKYKEDNMMSDNEKLKNVTFTVGGWPYGNSAYTVDGQTVKDDWSKSTNTGVIKGENIDDFTHYTKGAQKALSESIGYGFNDGDRGQIVGDGMFHPEAKFQDNLTPWTLPCRGSFIKVEPVKAGIATVYIFQEGNLWKDKTTDNHSSHVAWRPVYIADETGQLVDFIQTATNGKIGANDNFFVEGKRRAQFIESIDETYNSDQTLRSELTALRDGNHDRFKQLINNWENAGWKQKVIPTVGKGDDACGFMVMSDAIVRYTFNVLPGKTYYLFSNDSQIALSGFNFEEGRVLRAHEEDYATNPLRNVETGKLALSDATNYSVDANTIKDEVEVSYSGRTFTKGQWSSICLPFSMNNRQMIEQFGEGTKVVMLKKIEDGFITFVYHVNQDIIAGYPYLILPGKTTNSIKFNAYNNGKVSSPIFSITETGKTLFETPANTLNQYVFEGTLQKTAVNQYGYAMSSTGSLTRLTTADEAKRTVKPYRAYINYYGNDEEIAKAKQLGVKWETFDEESAGETTAIEEMLFEQGILTKNADVYSVNGQKVRTNADCLNGLSKGVYLINGKKIVK